MGSKLKWNIPLSRLMETSVNDIFILADMKILPWEQKKTQSVAIPHRTMVKQVKPISLISDEISFTKKPPGNKTILREPVHRKELYQRARSFTQFPGIINMAIPDHRKVLDFVLEFILCGLYRSTDCPKPTFIEYIQKYNNLH